MLGRHLTNESHPHLLSGKFVCLSIYACILICMHVEAKGQPQVFLRFVHLKTFFFETGSHGMELTCEHFQPCLVIFM